MVLDISVRRLQVFKAVAESGRFSIAAEQLGIAPPSVSAHISALERTVGQRLFERRRGQSPKLTAAGEAVYRHAMETVLRAEELSSALSAIPAPAPESFSFAAQRNLANVMLPVHVAAFLREHPGVGIATYSETQERVIELVREGRVDFGLLFALGPVEGLRSETIGAHRLVLVAAPSHPLAARSAIAPDELSDWPFVGGLAQSQFARLVSEILHRLGVKRLNVASQLQDSAGVKELVRHGVGIACTLHCAVAHELEEGSLVALDIAREPEPLEVRWAFDAQRDTPPIAVSFVQHLKDTRALG